MKTNLEKLVRLLDEFDTGMLVTQTSYGHLCSRPMTLQSPRPEQALWMVSTQETSSVENVEKNQNVNLAFERSSDKAWISIAAHARLNTDRRLIDKLWQDEWNVWLPKNSDRSKVTLIELEPIQIDFWEPEMGSLGRLFELAKARFTDTTPELSPVKTLHISDGVLASGMVGSK